VISPGDLVLVIVESSGRKREYFFKASPDAFYTTIAGALPGRALIGKPWGSRVELQNGVAYLLPPTLRDLQAHHFQRAGQVIYPKDMGFILLMADVGPGCRVVEAGTGSGALTLALANAVRPDGRIYFSTR